MDEVDRKILVELARDSRQPIYVIAKKMGVSRQTVAKRIERLKALGVEFTVRINPSMLGLNVRGYVMLRLDPRPEIRKKFEKKIEKLKQVVRLHYLLGPEDAILEVLAQNNEEISALVKKLHTFPGVRETETFLIHSTVKEENILNLLEAK